MNKPLERKTKNAKGKSKAKPKTKAKKNINELNPLAYEIIGVILIAFGIIEFLELGFVGRWTHSITLFLTGNLNFLVPLLCFLCAGMLMVRRRGVAFKKRVVYGVCFVGASLTILPFFWSKF